MSQQLHVLDRAFAALVGVRDGGARYAVARLVSTAGATYKPAVARWPEPEGYVPPQMADTVAIYIAMFRA